jgi:hypothetical protein
MMHADYAALLLAITVSVCTLMGVLLGGRLLSSAKWHTGFVVELKRRHSQACEQIKAHCQLEALYSEALADLSDKAMDAVQKELRAQMKDSGYARPMWGELKAQISIEGFCRLRDGALFLNR